MSARATLVEVAGYIRGITGNAYDAVLCGSPNEVQRELYERMRNYAVGDLVVEQSTNGMPSRDLDAVGRLLKVTHEPIDYPSWDEAEDGPKPNEKVFYIRTLDGRNFRWTNARFIACPTQSLLGERIKKYATKAA